MLDKRGEAIDNAIHRSKRYRSEVLQQGKFKEVQEVLDKPSEVCRMRIMQYSNTATPLFHNQMHYRAGLTGSKPNTDNT